MSWRSDLVQINKAEVWSSTGSSMSSCFKIKYGQLNPQKTNDLQQEVCNNLTEISTYIVTHKNVHLCRKRQCLIAEMTEEKEWRVLMNCNLL